MISFTSHFLFTCGSSFDFSLFHDLFFLLAFFLRFLISSCFFLEISFSFFPFFSLVFFGFFCLFRFYTRVFFEGLFRVFPRFFWGPFLCHMVSFVIEHLLGHAILIVQRRCFKKHASNIKSSLQIQLQALIYWGCSIQMS